MHYRVYAISQVEGRVLVNGENIGDEMRTVSGYVQQEDIFFPYLTVGEHLWFNVSSRDLTLLLEIAIM